MDLVDKIETLSKRVQETYPNIESEQATITALIMPFLKVLDYDIFNPVEVFPEYSADIGVKKGEKVDFAILKDGSPIMLIECKCCKKDLSEENISQLFRYFAVTKAKFAILTNGIIYHFFTDLNEPNMMDAKPFFEFNLLNFQKTEVDELKQFSKNFFNVEKIYQKAMQIKYIKEMKNLFSKELNNPSEDFVKHFAVQVYPGKVSKSIKDEFKEYVKKALNQYITERINERFKADSNVEQLLSQKNNESSQTIHINHNADLKKPKVGNLVRTTLIKMFNNNEISIEEVEQMKTRYYSKETFGIDYPLLVKAELSGYKKPPRYWKDIVEIYGEKYFICQEWFETDQNNDRQYFEKWLKLRKISD
jgi:predicted type IV restriction endonuclease